MGTGGAGADRAGAGGGAINFGGQLQGAGDPTAVPGFVLLAPPALSQEVLDAHAMPELDGVDEATLVRSSCRVSLTSADGSVLAGGIRYESLRPTSQRRSHWSAAFLWTADKGMRSGFIPGTHENEVSSLSADGSTVFGRGTDDPNQGFSMYRWSEQDSLVNLANPPYVLDYIHSTSADGKFALTRARNGDAVQTEALRWERGGGWESLGLSEWPSILRMSDDGSIVGLTNNSVWSEQGVYELPSPCHITELGPSGAATGACYPDGSFYLSKDGTFTAIQLPELYLSAKLISADGAVVLLSGDEDYYRWTTAAGPERIIELDDGGYDTSITLLGLSQDGQVLTANYENEVAAAWFPVRWSPQDGRQDLGPPSGYEHSVAVAHSADGSLVLGFAFNGSLYGEPGAEGVRPTKTSGHVVFWDESGPRDLAQELTGVEADLSVLEESTPLFIGRTADAIVIVGNGRQPWVARLPPR